MKPNFFDYQVGEKIMGWSWDEYMMLWITNDNPTLKNSLRNVEWQPSTNIEHAFMVVEKLRSIFSVELHLSGPWDEQCCYCVIEGKPSSYPDPGNEKEPIGYAEEISLPFAICKAALQAMQKFG